MIHKCENKQRHNRTTTQPHTHTPTERKRERENKNQAATRMEIKMDVDCHSPIVNDVLGMSVNLLPAVSVTMLPLTVSVNVPSALFAPVTTT